MLGKPIPGIQRGAGENGMFRRIVPGYRTRISFVPSKVTPRTYVSQTQLIHNPECLKPPAWRPRPHAGARAAAFERQVARQNGVVVLSDLPIGVPCSNGANEAFRREGNSKGQSVVLNYPPEGDKGEASKAAHLNKAGEH